MKFKINQKVKKRKSSRKNPRNRSQIFENVKYLNSPSILEYEDYLKEFLKSCNGDSKIKKCLTAERKRIQLLLDAIVVGYFYNNLQAKELILFIKQLVKESEYDLMPGYIALDGTY